MKNKNKVNLMGFIGQVQELKQPDGKRAMLGFSLATNKTWLDSGSNEQTKTQWHNIVVFGKHAIALATKLNLSKGDYVDIDGELDYGEYIDKNMVKHHTVQIIAKDVGVLAQKEQNKKG